MKKSLLKFSTISIATAIVLVTGGCGGSSDDSTNQTSAITTAGTGIDGVLAGSIVCLDTNANNACDTNEPSDTTNEDGKFTITSTSRGNLLLVGGTDNGTGLPFTGSLKAPAGSTVVTPLTSAVQALVESGSTQAEAETDIKKALGIDSSVILTTFDPLDQIENGTTENKTKAQAVLASQAQLQTLVHAASATVAGASTGTTTTIANTMDSVFKEIVKNFDGATAEVTLTSAQVTTATKAVASVVYKDDVAAQVAVKSVAAASAATAVQTAATTKTAITNAAVASATTTFNAAITTANTTLQSDVNASSAAAKMASNALTSEQRIAIDTAQKLQEAEEAKIAAATAAAIKAAADLATAKAAAEADAVNKAKYDAYLEAIAEDQRKAAAQSAAEAEAAEAAAEAAKLEADLKATTEAKALALALANAELAEAQAKAASDAAAAAARIAAAEQAAADALVAETLEAAQAAAAAADLAAAKNIALLEATSAVNLANGFARQAELDLNATVVIQNNNTSINFDANVTTATNATNAAKTAAALALTKKNLILDGTNATAAQGFAAEAKAAATEAGVEAKIAEGVLLGAKQLVLDAQAAGALAEAQAKVAVAIAASRLIVANADSNATADLSSISLYVTDAESDLDLTQKIASIYTNSTAAQAEATKAQTALNAAKAAQTAAVAEAVKVTEAVTSISGSNVTQTQAATYATQADIAAKAVDAQTLKVEVQAGLVADALSAVKGIQASIENALTAVEGQSVNVATAVTTLNTLNIQTDSLTEALIEIKNSLSTINSDEKVLAAIITIVEVANSSEMSNLITVTGSTSVPNLDALSGKTDALIELASTATTLGGTTVMHEMATKLKNASDVIGTAFASRLKIMAYDGLTITYDDSLAIRSTALSFASALDLFASYTYGDIAYIKPKEATVETISYEYQEGMIDPKAMLSQTTFFKMTDTSRLAAASAYLEEAANIMVDANVSNISIGDLNITDINASVDIKAAFESDGVLSVDDGKIKSINIQKLFSSSEYIDRNDFTLPTSYLGKSAEAIAEYEKNVLYNTQWLAYNVAECQNFNQTTVEQPSAVIDWDLIYNSEETTVVNLNRDESIKFNQPIYYKTVQNNSYVDWSDCSIATYYYGDYSDFNANFEPKINATFSNVIIFKTMQDVASLHDVFYYASYNYNDYVEGNITVDSNTALTRNEVRTKYTASGINDIVSVSFPMTYSFDSEGALNVMNSETNASIHITLESSNDESMYIQMEIDADKDGSVDATEDLTWYFTRPLWF